MGIEAIVIPTGRGAKEDLERARRAMDYCREKGLPMRYLISGLGPDSDRVISQGESSLGLDFHQELYDFMLKNCKGIFGWDTNSTDSAGNIKNSFPDGVSGEYAIVSYPLHLARLKRIFKRAVERGEASKDVSLIYVPTGQSLRQTVYGAMSLIKDFRKHT